MPRTAPKLQKLMLSPIAVRKETDSNSKNKIDSRRESSLTSVSNCGTSMSSDSSDLNDVLDHENSSLVVVVTSLRKDELEAALQDPFFQNELVAALLASSSHNRLSRQVRFVAAVLELRRRSPQTRKTVARKIWSLFFGTGSSFRINKEDLPQSIGSPRLSPAWSSFLDPEPPLFRIADAIITSLLINQIVTDTFKAYRLDQTSAQTQHPSTSSSE